MSHKTRSNYAMSQRISNADWLKMMYGEADHNGYCELCGAPMWEYPGVDIYCPNLLCKHDRRMTNE